ncbi:MAG: hypothetical protein KDC54_00220 [Lewinella sp.]|nr:hypothetical protein [Lewinella sp.]
MKYLKYLLLLAVIGAAVGYYMWNKPHRNMERAAADVTIPTAELFTAFDADEQAANAEYLDKVIQVTGEVRNSSRDEDGHVKVTLDSGDAMFGVICELDEHSEHPRTEFTPGETVTMKGLCTGKLMDVVLVRCVEVNP